MWKLIKAAFRDFVRRHIIDWDTDPASCLPQMEDHAERRYYNQDNV